jgi:hypothetical protein
VTAPLVGFDSTVNRAAPYQEDDSCPASSILSGQRQLDFPMLFERYQQ